MDTVANTDGAPVKAIRAVIAEMRKDHTPAFCNAFAATYGQRTGARLNLQALPATRPGR